MPRIGVPAREDWRRGWMWVWRIASLALTLAWLAPLTLEPSQIAALAPRCTWKTRYHRACPCCGMTSAFVQIARGRWKSAADLNRASLPLYFILTGNSLAAATLAARKLWRNRSCH